MDANTNSPLSGDAADYKAVAAIEARAMAREANGPALNAAADFQMAADDVRDFRTINGEFPKTDAAVQLSINMAQYPTYKAGLEKADPAVVAVIVALDAENNAKVAAKEDRKAAVMAEMREALVERAAKWSPAEAAQQAFRDNDNHKATQDSAERHFLRNDMGLNAGANPHYEAALVALDASLAAEVKAQNSDRESEAMTSRPGARMTYNDTPGFAGAEIINPNGTRTTFGNKDAIHRFAENAGLTDEEKSTLIAMDALANKHRTTPSVAADVVRVNAESLNLTDSDLARVAVVRARDTAQARGALGLNTIEQDTENQRAPVIADLNAKSAAWASKSNGQEGFAPGSNGLESDEIFTASQRPSSTVVPPDVEKAYLRIGAKFYDRADTDSMVFEDKGNKLETRSNSESVAKSLVRIAEARGWDEIKVSGSETFRKEVWLEAAQRGMSVKGYRVTEQDQLNLAHITGKAPLSNDSGEAKQFRARESDTPSEAHNTPKTPMGQAFASEKLADAVNKFPELAGAAAAVAVIEKRADADGLSAAQKAIAMARVRQNVVNSIERGEIPRVSVTQQVEVEKERTPIKEHSR